MTLVVMAAGMGSRYGGLKQLDPVGPSGEFIIDYSVYDAIQAGFDKVVFIIKEENLSLFQETVGNRIAGHIKVEYAFQRLEAPQGYPVPENRVKPWGTGHAVLSAKDHVDGNFAVINADDFYGRESYRLIADYLKQPKTGAKAHYCMAGFVLKNTLTENGTVARGICETDENGNLVNITERTKIKRVEDGTVKFFDIDENGTSVDENTIVSMNCWGFEKSFFNSLENGFFAFLEANKNDLAKCEFFLPTAVKESIARAESEVKVLKTNAKWYGVTYREDKESVVNYIREEIQKGVYPENLWNK
ncbi:MAG TPA: sugar phosphate nucleotidyltransferase [Bacillota bacterium]|nr:sugar phosphate nucleotidyltransferase [Bacillota bacterium]HOK68684.1 sugar phosphate nucleotidyltransferase [Bacillota bacterium]HPP85370.1 sugar phosphate nucleotidyltransferase [Bacillota bacterium]